LWQLWAGGILGVDAAFAVGALRGDGANEGKELRRVFGKPLGGQMIGDRFIEDAYAYRIR
jgi:hypothetical protein